MFEKQLAGAIGPVVDLSALPPGQHQIGMHSTFDRMHTTVSHHATDGRLCILFSGCIPTVMKIERIETSPRVAYANRSTRR